MRALRLFLCLALLGAPSAAMAAPPAPQVEMQGSADADVVAEGETFRVELKVTASMGDISTPELLSDPRQVDLVGQPSMGNFHEMNVTNGVMVQKQGVNVTWRVRALKVGKVSIKPSVFVNGVRVTGKPILIRVVPPGQAPARRPPDPFGGSGLPDPFGAFGQMFGGQNPFGDLDPSLNRGLLDIPTDPHLALDQARNKGTFLHAGVDKTHAVIGEQVTFSIYIYIDVTAARDPEFNDVHEASATDFVRHSLTDDDKEPKTLGHARVGGRIWAVRLLRRVALFPIKAGDLKIGPMSLSSVGKPASDKRESEELTVHVSEPPIAGRPPGYAIGDVGQFELAASVTPQEVDHGGMTNVTLELSGTGNLPAKIVPPARQGIEWLEPQVRDVMGKERKNVKDADKYGGKRTFTYLVRLSREGNIDLGEINIPFYNPDAHAYDVAKASLGSVLVKPGGAAKADPSAGDNTPLSSLPAARTTRSGAPAIGAHVADTNVFWLALAAPSLAFAAFAGGRAASRRVRERVKASGSSPEAVLKQRRQDADAACAGNDTRAADAAIVRALEHATIVRAQVNVRAIETREIAAKLREHGVAEGSAETIQAILAECEAARFVPDGGDIAASRERWARAQKAIDELKKGPVS
jgi:hypothetical protein